MSGQACWEQLAPCFAGLLGRTRDRCRGLPLPSAGEAAGAAEVQAPPPAVPEPEPQKAAATWDVVPKDIAADAQLPRPCLAEPVADAGIVLAPAPSAVVAGFSRPQPPPAPLDSEGDESSGEVEEGWVPPVAELGPDGLPSLGSARHDAGECRRCCFFPKGRCTNGHDCKFCHFDHDRRKRLKKKRSRTGAELATPSSTTGSAAGTACLLSTSLTPSGASIGRSVAPITMPYPLLSPGHGMLPTTPMTPSMPPPTPPALSAFQQHEQALPPPPAEEPQVPADFEEKLEQMRQVASDERAPSSAGSARSANAVAPPPPLSTLEGLTMGAAWGPYYCPPEQQYYATLGSSALPGALPGTCSLPPVSESTTPQSVTATPRLLHRGGAQNAQPSGLEKDSPRSVILTLSGAWGALKKSNRAEFGQDGAEIGTTPDRRPSPRLGTAKAAVFSRASLLAYRAAASSRKKPLALKALRAKVLPAR